MNIKIELMKEEHLNEVLKIQEESFSDPWSEKHFIYELKENDFAHLYILKNMDNDEIIGYIDFLITFNSATISQIAIKDKYRGNNYSMILLNHMESCFIKDGDDQVECTTLEVRKSNLGAIHIYKKFGFLEIITKPNYYKDGEDAIYMIKRSLVWQ